MSIKLMSAIFETEFRDLPLGDEERMAKASSLKIVMLAIADHANDEGEAYPGFVRLILKTSLSRQGLTDVLKALRHNGIITVGDEKSKLGSNLYQIEMTCFPKITDKTDNRLVVKWLDQSSGFELGSQVALNEVVKPLDHNHQLTIIKPSLGDKSPDMPLDWKLAHGQEITEADLDQTDAQYKDAANLIATGMGANSDPAYALAYAFMAARKIVIPTGKISGQRKAIKEMLEMKVAPEHIRQAVLDLTAKGMTITDLFSVSKTAEALANPSPEQSGYNPLGLSI